MSSDHVFSKRAAFFNGLKSKVGHIMAKATALRVNLNLAPSIPLLRAPLHATLTPSSSAPLTSPTTSSPPMEHERASSTLLKVVAFTSRSFTPPFTVFVIHVSLSLSRLDLAPCRPARACGLIYTKLGRGSCGSCGDPHAALPCRLARDSWRLAASGSRAEVSGLSG